MARTLDSAVQSVWIAEINNRSFRAPTKQQALNAAGDYLRDLSDEELVVIRDNNLKLRIYLEGTDPNTPIDGGRAPLFASFS